MMHGDEEYSTSTSKEIEVDIEVFKKLSSGHIQMVWMIQLALCLLYYRLDNSD